MMNNVFSLLIAGTISGSILFGLLQALDLVFGECYVKYIYQMAKIVLIIYLISAIAIYYMIFFIKSEVVLMYKSDDFQYIRQWSGISSIHIRSVTSLISCVLFVWFLVFTILFFLSMIQNLQNLRKIMSVTSEIRDERLQLFREVKETLHVKRPIGLYEHPTIGSPCLAGIIRPVIILPSDHYSTDEWRMFLRHELLHYTSHDLFYRFIIDVVQKIHWFNPLIYFFLLKFYEMSELVCDEKAVAGYDISQRAKYARLVNSVTYSNTTIKLLASFYGSYQRTERRIKHIMKQKKKRVSVIFAMAMGTMIVVCPIVSYASISVTNEAEAQLIDTHERKFDLMVNEEMTDFAREVSGYAANQIIGRAVRGDNTITDYVLKATGTAVFSPVNLNENAEVSIVMSSDNSGDSYIGGIIDSNGKRTYVTSTKGVIAHTFTIAKAGQYEVFFQGKNGSGGSDIILNGTISIE